MDKHFTLYNVNFTQRSSDNRLDATQICHSRQKPFANWSRTKKTQEFLSDYTNPVEKFNRHMWIIPECAGPLIEWVTGEVKHDFSLLNIELKKPFEPKVDEPQPTHKACTGCKEYLPLENFGPKKTLKDGLDRYCKDCLKEERAKNSAHHTARSTEYYYKNKEKCNQQRTENKNKTEENKEKAREACRKSAAKKRAQVLKERKEVLKKEEEAGEENLKGIQNMGKLVLSDKNEKPYQVVCRESDGYINVTNLCKAGGKRFDNWHRIDKTKRFLEVLTNNLKSEYQKYTSPHKSVDLIQITSTGKNDERGTWVHPKVAINIAQWISPKFDVQVTSWVHQLLVLGSVSLTDQVTDEEIIDVQVAKTKHNRLVMEGGEDGANVIAGEIVDKMKSLENRNLVLARENERLSKYLERKKRIQYDQKKVVYVVKHDEFENCYKVGIASNLTSRMSNYDTCAPDNYKVVFYAYTMYNGTVELMIRKKFIQSLYTHNKEWYELPNGPSELIENIERAIQFFEQ